MKLLIKGMVCDRCIYVLSEELTKLGLEIVDIRLGEVVLKRPLLQEAEVRTMLQKNGFDLLYNKDEKMVDMIKVAVENGILKQLEAIKPIKFSKLISEELDKDYESLSTLFSTIEGCTLEKYIISKKIQKVKELLVYTNQSLSEIAHSLGYSSPAYLSNQLKKYSGFTSSYYKQIRRDKLSVMKEFRE